MDGARKKITLSEVPRPKRYTLCFLLNVGVSFGVLDMCAAV